MIFICDTKKGGCGKRYGYNEDKDNDEYVQCPWCGRISKNPIFKSKIEGDGK